MWLEGSADRSVPLCGDGHRQGRSPCGTTRVLPVPRSIAGRARLRERSGSAPIRLATSDPTWPSVHCGR